MTVGWLDFEPEPDTTGDGSGDPDKYILTIADGLGTTSWPEEIAVIVHRTCNGKFPLDGQLANKKRRNAQVICDALNEPGPGDDLWLGPESCAEGDHVNDDNPGRPICRTCDDDPNVAALYPPGKGL